MKPLRDIVVEPFSFDFFLSCRRLEASHPDRPRLSESATRREEYASFGQDPFFAFPMTTIDRARFGPDQSYEVIVRFMGLLGPQGALPLSITEEAYSYSLSNDDALPRFLDLFNNRFIQLFFRAWANSRPLIYRDRPSDFDRFSAYLGTGIGLGSAPLRGQDAVPDQAKIAYAGLMAPAAKSASRLRSLISGMFGVRVEVDEFVGTRLLFEPDQRSRLGQSFATLGADLLIGAGVYTVQDKIRLRLFASTLADYEQFLPGGDKSRKLSDMVSFYVGPEIEWDVELALPVGEVEPVRLGRSGRLGWTSWVSPNWSVEKDAYRTDARFDLAKRFDRQAA